MSIGSVSKMITAFAVLQLVERGEIELDGPVAGQMPEFDLDDARGARITVRQLLTHTSGLPNPLVVAPAADPEERVAELRTVPLVSDPGSRYVYSNLGYHTAARLVETRSGEPFADLPPAARLRAAGDDQTPARSRPHPADQGSTAATSPPTEGLWRCPRWRR